MTVPPAEIAANRSLLAVLVATNFLGVNAPAIAATEALYAEMWAQDAAAMYGYAASSAAATVLTPFGSPHQNTDPGGTASQAAAVSQAATTPAGNVQSAISVVPQALSGATAPAQSDPLGTLSDLISIFASAPSDVALFTVVIPQGIAGGAVDLPFSIVDSETGQHTDRIISGWNGEDPALLPDGMPNSDFPATLVTPGAAPPPTVSASLGNANVLGRLSVPSNWTVAAPEIRSVALVSPLTEPAAAAVPAVEAGSANAFNQMGIAGMAGQAMAGPPAANADQDRGKPVTHARLTGRAAGTASVEPEVTPAPRTVVTGVAAAIREIAKLRDAGQLSEQEYNEQKKRLLEVSIGHRPLG
jgi:PPE-repeat protein